MRFLSGDVNGYDYFLDYNISVTTDSAALGLRIIDATLGINPDGSNGNGGLWSVGKGLSYTVGGGGTKGGHSDTTNLGTLYLDNQNLHSNVDFVGFAGQPSVDVGEEWIYDGNSIIVSTSNTFKETMIPEPATIIVWSLLGLASVFGVRVWPPGGLSCRGTEGTNSKGHPGGWPFSLGGIRRLPRSRPRAAPARTAGDGGGFRGRAYNHRQTFRRKPPPSPATYLALFLHLALLLFPLPLE